MITGKRLGNLTTALGVIFIIICACTATLLWAYKSLKSGSGYNAFKDMPHNNSYNTKKHSPSNKTWYDNKQLPPNATFYYNKRLPVHNKTFKICPNFIGRLGNQMFIYASSYAIALSKRMKLEIDKDSELLRIFKLKVDLVDDTSDCKTNKLKTINERQGCAFDRKLLEFCPTSSIRLGLYLQSYIYFDDYKKEIRKQFTFKDDIQAAARTMIQRIIVKNKVKYRKDITLIGMHIRRGDRVDLSLHNKVAGYKLATKEYLQKSVDWYTDRFKNPAFVVASNGMDWVTQNMPKNINAVYLMNNTPAVDMATLSMCDQTISTFGSFSWWIGWLAGGNVTYFKWPFTEEGWFRREFSEHLMDHYYPQWIGF